MFTVAVVATHRCPCCGLLIENYYRSNGFNLYGLHGRSGAVLLCADQIICICPCNMRGGGRQAVEEVLKRAVKENIMCWSPTTQLRPPPSRTYYGWALSSLRTQSSALCSRQLALSLSFVRAPNGTASLAVIRWVCVCVCVFMLGLGPQNLRV